MTLSELERNISNAIFEYCNESVDINTCDDLASGMMKEYFEELMELKKSSKVNSGLGWKMV